MFKKRIRVRVHKGFFIKNKDKSDAEEYLFINIKNQCKYRNAYITHVWVEDIFKKIHVLEPTRPLPFMLLPGKSWETWIKCSEFTSITLVLPYESARVRLSKGNLYKVYKSKRNENVAPFGSVPNGSY